MTSFEDRKDTFEKKYAHDQELMFKVEARCCKLFGLWVAEQLGLEGEAANDYAKAVVSANLEVAGFDDVKRHIQPDLVSKKIGLSATEIDSRLAEFLSVAKEQVLAEQSD